MQGIQKVVLDIIETSRITGLPFITKSAIVEEAKKTSLADFAEKHHVRDKESQLMRMVDQALMNLKKKGLIKQRKRGHWTIDKSSGKYHPVVCKALVQEYEVHCPKCDTYTYEKTKNKESLGWKCKSCKKGRLTVSAFRQYCPVRETYIGDPIRQCELLHGTNMHTLSRQVFPMKTCYFGETPKKLELEYAQEKVRKELEREDKESRFFNKDIHDPESKAYLPKLHGKVE